MADADIDHLSLLSGGMLRWLNSGPGQTQPLPSRGLPWLVKVGRRAEKKFLPGFKMPKQAAPVMQGANCTLANIIGTTLCNTIYNLHLNFEVVLNCSYALFFIVSILTSSAVTTNNPFISMEKVIQKRTKVIILTKPEVQIVKLRSRSRSQVRSRSGPGQVPGQVQKVQGLRTQDLDLG